MADLAVDFGWARSGEGRFLVAIVDKSIAAEVERAIELACGGTTRVTSASDCIECLETKSFSCLIIEWELPVEGALTTLRWLVERREFDRLPRVVIGKSIDDEGVFDVYKEGADLALQHPVNAKDLAHFLGMIG